MGRKNHILLIEDEEDIAALIKLQAELCGFKLHVEVDGINGLSAIEREKPDLVILDVMLPGQSGYDVCRKVKNNTKLRHIPIIILSAKHEELDTLLGLELGADDYMTKPFSVRILMSKVKAILRRSRESEEYKNNIVFGDFTLDTERFLVKKGKKIINVTLSEFGILSRLVNNTNKILSRNQLIDDIHNDDAFVVDRNIDVHIAAIRRKLGPNFLWIETVRGIGYRFRTTLEVNELNEKKDLSLISS